MPRRAVSKLHTLEARHPGLIDKVHAMFAEFWTTDEVRHMIQTQYGVALSRITVARYKQKHWQAQREFVEQMSAAQAASEEIAGEAGLVTTPASAMPPLLNQEGSS